MKDKEPLTYAVPVGESARIYRIGDYISAIDDITCYFSAKTQHSSMDFARALDIYSQHLTEEL